MIEIIVINQAHPVPHINAIFDSSKNKRIYLNPEEKALFNLIAESQYHIARFLGENPGIPVILEQHKALRHGEEPEWDKFVSTVFPEGLSNIPFENLNFNQKKVLATRSGCKYAVFKNVIQQTYSDHPRIASNNIFGALEKIQADEQVAYFEKVEATTLYNQMREYFALKNAEKVAQQTGSNKVILIYGAAHSFADVQAACFPHLTLRMIDMSKKEKAKPYSRQLISDLLSQRPLVNCSNLALGPEMSLPLPASNNSANAVSNYPMQYGTIALAGLLVSGLFRCCSSRKQSKASQEAEVANSQANQITSVANRNQDRKNKFKHA